jgi:hypothetical protein
MGMFYAIASPTILDFDMTQLIKNIADKTHFTVADSPIWRAKVQEYSLAIVASCVEQISDLQGYSGVGTDGNPYDTASWNAALAAAQDLLRTRFELDEPKSN